MMPAATGRLGVALGLLAVTVAIGLAAASPAGAAKGDIDDVATSDGTVQVLFSLPDLPEGTRADTTSVTVAVDGDQLEATAEAASDGATVERVTVLAIDTSDSMAGAPFAAALDAARSFIALAPDDVRIGIVSFAGDAQVVESPTTDKDALRSSVAELEISRFTRLYDGIGLALDTLGSDVQGSVLVLSDGRDTSGEPVDDTLDAVRASGYHVDVVALRQSGAAFDALTSIADAGGGDITNVNDPRALQQLFEEQANVLRSQLLVTFDAPADRPAGDAAVEVSVDAAGETYTDSALIALPDTTEQVTSASATPVPVDEPQFVIGRSVMLGGVVALGLGLALVVAMMTGAFRLPDKKATVNERLDAWRLGGAGTQAGQHGAAGPGVVTKAVEVTDKMLGTGGLNARLATKLDAAGMSLQAAEWLLLHAGIAVGAGCLGVVVGGTVLGIGALFGGLLLPWMYLSRKASKRIKSFNAQLADTLQLVSGSLSAGQSLAQSLDSVVREGNEPIASEFRRALVEQRLGIEVEAALEGVAGRMKSKDFSWVVMAIRIQREVGGNLAGLLLTVAATLREREFLRRQVKTLSAEGRMSAWILGALPPGFFCYLMVVQPAYLEPMITTTIGLMMLGAAGVMMAIGVVLLSQLVKVEVYRCLPHSCSSSAWSRSSWPSSSPSSPRASCPATGRESRGPWTCSTPSPPPLPR